MRVVVQRVSAGSVTVDNKVVGAITQGYVILLGITHADTEAEAEWLGRVAATPRRNAADQISWPIPPDRKNSCSCLQWRPRHEQYCMAKRAVVSCTSGN